MRYIECSCSILANKWRIFHRPLNVSVDFTIDIVKACCILHYFVRMKDGYKFEDTLTVEGFIDDTSMSTPSTSSTLQGGPKLNSIRNNFADYFDNDVGKLEWQ